MEVGILDPCMSVMPHTHHFHGMCCPHGRYVLGKDKVVCLLASVALLCKT